MNVLSGEMIRIEIKERARLAFGGSGARRLGAVYGPMHHVSTRLG